MIVDRADGVMNLCEIKYSLNAYVITKEYADKMITRMETLKNETKTKKSLHLTMITSNGLPHNEYYSYINNDIIFKNILK